MLYRKCAKGNDISIHFGNLLSPEIAWLKELTDEVRAEYEYNMSMVGVRTPRKEMNGKETKHTG